MPVIEWEETLDLLTPVRGAIPPEVEPLEVESDVSGLDVAVAALRKANLATNIYDSFLVPDFNDQQGYNPISDPQISGNERFAMRLVRSNSPEETRFLIQKSLEEERGERVLAQAGGWGAAALVAAGVLSPETLVAMSIPVAAPVAWGSRGARIGIGVGAQATLDIGAETFLHDVQVSRTLSESGFRIGAGVLLTGAFGRFVTRVPKDEFEKLTKQLGRDLETDGSTVGSASIDFQTTLADEGIALGGGFLAKTLGRISPTTRVLQSPIKSARQLVQRMVEVPYWLEKNLRGVPSPDNIETAIKRGVNHRRMSVRNTYDASFAEYSKRVGRESVSRQKFGEAVSATLRRGDKSDIPEIATFASDVRKMFEADKKLLKELDVLPEDFNLLGAESYFPRVYDAEAIVADRIGFETAIRNWFTDNPKPVLKDTEVLVSREGAPTPDSRFFAEEAETLADGRSVVVRDNRGGEAGRLVTQERGDTVQILRTELSPSFRGKGLGQRMIAEMVDDAETAGKTLVSDSEVTRAQLRAYEGLRRRGYQVEYEDEASVKKFLKEEGDEPFATPGRPVVKSIKSPAKVLKEADTAGLSTSKLAKLKEAAKEVDKLKKEAIKLEEKANTPVYREPAEIDSSVKQTLDRILGTVRGLADVGHGGSVNPKPLKERVLDVPDEILEPWLVNDFDRVMQGYIRAMQPQLEMRRTFGSITLKNEIDQIQDSSHVLINKAETNAAKEEIRSATAKNISDIVGLRDRLLNIEGPRMNQAAWFIKAARFARSYNYVRMLGAQTLSSLSDYGHVVSRFGLVRTGAITAKYLTNLKANRIIRADAKRIGTAIDWYIDTRGKTLAEIGDELAGSRLEKGMQWATQKFTRVSGMATWNSAVKGVTAALEQDAILRGASKGWSSLSKIRKAKLAQNGIGEDELARITQQFSKYGERTEGLSRARTDLWDDREAAKLFEDAVVKVADIMVITRSVGDIPMFMDSEVGKVLMQFKSFGIAATNRIMIPLAQQLAHGDLAAANGLAAMLGLGATTYYMKELAAGREPNLAPDRIIAESLNWSGALGYLPDIYDPMASLVHGPRLSRYSDTSPLAFALGPTFGTTTDIMKTIPEITDLGLKQADVHKLRKLLPLQNIFYLRRIINALEGEVGEVLGAEGATTKSFVDRLTELEKVDE